MHVTDRVTYLLKEGGTVSLGAAKDQLVIEGVGTDVNNPLLRELAGRLRRHHLGAISFHQGVSKQEILQFLTLMAEEPDLTDQPLGLAPRERREQQPNIRIHPVAYDSLRLLDDDGAVEEDEEARTARTRYAQLWVGLAKAAVARAGRDERSPDEEVHGDPEDASRDPAAVAQAISEHSESHAYDQMIVGYLLQIVQELRVASGPDAAQLNQRMGELVAAMEPGALSRLLHMGGDSGQRHQFLMNASRGMKGESVLRLIEAASQSEEKKVSHPMLRMLGKLAQHADGATGAQRRHALESIQEQVSDLVTGWAPEDTDPQGYSEALSGMSAAKPDVFVEGVQLAETEPRRIVDMAFEMDVVGESVADAVRQLVTLQPDAGALATRHLDDPRWYVTRNMLRLLSGLDIAPEEFVPDVYLRHEDHRVRYEALRLCTRVGRGREKAIIHGLDDVEEKTVRFALNAALVDCPRAALPFVASLAFSGPTDIRLLAVQVLETVVGQTARSALLKITRSKRGLFRWKHPPKDPVYLAALRALHSYPDDRHVRSVLDLALRRPDPEIAVAARQGSDGGGWGGWGG